MSEPNTADEQPSDLELGVYRPRKVRSDNKSGCPGVYQTPSGRWKAEVRCQGRRYRLGTFDDFEEAARAVARKKDILGMD